MTGERFTCDELRHLIKVCVCVFLRQSKQDVRTATAKVDEMTKFMKNVQDQMQRTVCVCV